MAKRLFLLALLPLLYGLHASFCGFYVAKADATIFNRASQVIIARSGDQTAVTMGSDFRGDIKDFAMVIPVPSVIERNQIRIAKQEIFDKLDAYSGPRLVEYQDVSPCQRQMPTAVYSSARANAGPQRESKMQAETAAADYHVEIMAEYSVGEYDIIILKADESNGLERWLADNGYKIPKGASDVLEPYIKSNLKFFVVKVNLAELDNLRASGQVQADANGFIKLRPIQMTFKSEKFMLPIRLGMANATGDQDLIIYSFTDKGRTECTNYRTAKIPTDREIPEFTRNVFGEFYKKLFDRAWEKEGKNVVLQEYGWDLSSSNYVKCDPCATTPPTYAELREAGVFWATAGGNQGWGGSDYSGDFYLTRLHVRYGRATFPQDLMFQATPDKTPFQGRYIMRHPAPDLSCDEAKPYLRQLVARRQRELNEFQALTGWLPANESRDYVSRYQKMLGNDDSGYLEPLKDFLGIGQDNNPPTPPSGEQPVSANGQPMPHNTPNYFPYTWLLVGLSAVVAAVALLIRRRATQRLAHS